MHYFFERTDPVVTYERPDPNATGLLLITFEYGIVHQEDGHCPWHKDDARDLASATINSVSREVIIEVLKANNIQSVKIYGHGVQVFPTDVKDRFGLPMKKMEIRLSLIPQEDIYKNTADQIIDSINWKTSKSAMCNIGKYYWYDDIKDEAKCS